MSTKQSPREIAKDYLASLRRSAAGEGGSHDYLDYWADDIHYTLPGLWPMGGVYESKADYVKLIAPMMDSNVDDGSGGEPGAGLYGYEFIEEGNKVCVLARSRGRDGRGMPYTNSFFLWMEFNDEGKLVRYLDEADFSSGWQAFWGVHLE